MPAPTYCKNKHNPCHRRFMDTSRVPVCSRCLQGLLIKGASLQRPSQKMTARKGKAPQFLNRLNLATQTTLSRTQSKYFGQILMHLVLHMHFTEDMLGTAQSSLTEHFYQAKNILRAPCQSFPLFGIIK